VVSARGEFGRGEPPIDDARLVLVVADAELDVTGPAPGDFGDEVRLYTHSSMYQRVAAGRSSAQRFMVLTPRSMVTSVPHVR
jgi:hypothetical protein